MIKLICGDSLDVMGYYDSKSFDLIFVDPPYNIGADKDLKRPEGGSYSGTAKDDWDKFSTFEKYDDFTLQWMTEVKRLLKDTGSVFICGTYHNIYRIGYHLQNLDFWILNEIIWLKTNPTPNFQGVRFCQGHESIIWASKKKKSKYKFNYQELKKINFDKQMKAEWIISSPTGKRRIKVDGEKLHSSQKPKEILFRILTACTDVDDMVLDPFLGSGTTAVMCKKMKRKCVGIDINQKYVDASKVRVRNTKVWAF